QTAASIARYQSRSGLEVTGTLNEETVHSLGLVHSEAMSPSATPPSPARIEAWRALRKKDREFLQETKSSPSNQPVSDQNFDVSSSDEIRDFVAGFVVAGISEDVEPELEFYAARADYYDNGLVSKDFIRKDILRYDQKWPIRRYWLDGDIEFLSDTNATPAEVRFQIRYIVQNEDKQARGRAIKTLKLQKTQEGLEIISVRETTLK
ncbi:MAG TPA: hypothetical protein VIT23_00790, partial [Terrimicrobiaceae bacterium]